MENPALFDDQHALDGCGFIHSTIYFTSAASALLFTVTAVLLVFTICKVRRRYTTRKLYSNLHYHQLPRNTTDVKMPSAHTTEMLRMQCVRTDTVPDPPDNPQLTLKLRRFLLSMPRFGRLHQRTQTGNTTNLEKRKTVNEDFIGSVVLPSYTETVTQKLSFPDNLSSKGLMTASQYKDRKEANSHYNMPPSYVSLSNNGAVLNGYGMVDNRNVQDTNVYNGTNDVAHGDCNVFNGNDSYIDGNRNVINGSNCKVTGSGNVITGNHCQIYGDKNIINGDSNILHGQQVVINGHNDNIHANNRIINGSNIVNYDSDIDLSRKTNAFVAKAILYGNNDQGIRDNMINNDYVNNAVTNLMVGNGVVNDWNAGRICNVFRATPEITDNICNLGDTNVYNGTNDVAHGEHNVFNGNNSVIYGNSNVINGDDNTLNGNNVVINGHNDNIHANNRVINGSNIND